MKGKTLWRTGAGIGIGWIVLDRWLHILPDWLAIVLFMIAWILIIAGLWKEKRQKL